MRTDIFPYRDAQGKQLWADPLAVERRLRTLLQADPRHVFADLLSDDPGRALPAGGRLAMAACHAFELGPPLDPETGEGVTEAVWIGCLREWVGWMEKNVFGGSSLPTASTPSPSIPLSPAAS